MNFTKEPGATDGAVGEISSDFNSAGLTVSSADVLSPFQLTLMVTLPGARVCTSPPNWPPLKATATFLSDEVKVAWPPTNWVVSSE